MLKDSLEQRDWKSRLERFITTLSQAIPLSSTSVGGNMDKFNCIMTTLELQMWKEGVEYNHDGETVFVHTPYAMGVSIEEII